MIAAVIWSYLLGAALTGVLCGIMIRTVEKQTRQMTGNLPDNRSLIVGITAAMLIWPVVWAKSAWLCWRAS